MRNWCWGLASCICFLAAALFELLTSLSRFGFWLCLAVLFTGIAAGAQGWESSTTASRAFALLWMFINVLGVAALLVLMALKDILAIPLGV
jgi:hypothetical protein